MQNFACRCPVLTSGVLHRTDCQFYRVPQFYPDENPSVIGRRIAILPCPQCAINDVRINEKDARIKELEDFVSSSRISN